MTCTDCEKDSPSAFTMNCSVKVCRDCAATHENKCDDCKQELEAQADEEYEEDE